MHSALTDMVLDIVQNSVDAGSPVIMLDYMEETTDTGRLLRVCVGDTGKGMDEETLKNALDPFYSGGKHAGRRVGLGLPFLKQQCEMLSGRFEIESRPGEGTSVFFEIPLDGVDTPPEGNVPGLFAQCLLFDGNAEMVIHRRINGSQYRVQKSEILDALGSLNDAGAVKLAMEYMAGLEESIKEEENGKTDASRPA